MEELLELIPGNEQYLKLARKVTEKLLAASTKRFDRQDYRGAASLLASIPAQMRDHDYESARLRIENVEWLERQFAVEPFAMIALGRLAVRFEQETPHNPNAKQIKDELVRRIKSPVPDPRLPFHPWQGSRQSWLGGSVGYLGYPTCVDYEKPSQLTKLPGRFGIAIGLALQGLGVSRITEGFPVAKKNRLAMLVAKKPTSCWGIDLGTTGLRAVLLTIEKVNPNNSPAKSPEPPVDTGKDRSTNAASVVIRVSEAYSEEFELPLCRLGNDLKSTECIQQAMARFLESVQEKEAPFWVNLPAGDLISRFLRLPPVKDKQAEAFLEVEAKTKIPVPLDTLDMIQWLGAVDSRSAYGRPAFLGAAKKSAVNARVDLLGRCRIKLAGMQADQVALVNYLSHEFGPELMGSSADDSGCFPTFAIIEGGASFTTLHLVNNESFWFWSSESGGEDLTSTLARVGRMTMQAAEDLKRNPAKIDHPHDGFEPVEQRLADFRMRLKKVFAEGVQQNGRVRVDRTWCCGGAPLTHGWIRHMVIKD
jgi:Tfp pilus assembly PilM family ATPase